MEKKNPTDTMDASEIEFYSKLGENFRTLRQHSGYSMEDVSKAIGVTYQQIQKYEFGKNRFPISTLCAALLFLQYPVDTFLHSLGVEVGGCANTIRIPRKDFDALLAVNKKMKAISKELGNLIKRYNIHNLTT